MANGASMGNPPKASAEDVERARQAVLNTKWSDGPIPIMLGPLSSPPSPIKRRRGRPKGSKDSKAKNSPIPKNGVIGKDSPTATCTSNATSSPPSLSSPYTLISPSTMDSPYAIKRTQPEPPNLRPNTTSTPNATSSPTSMNIPYPLISLSTADSPYAMNRALPEPPNLGPNPPGRQPLPYGLLDFQDIALFYWPPYRQRRDFELREQCLILGHRNSRLSSITAEELIEVQEWIGWSETISSEEQRVDIRAWRLGLDEEDLKGLTRLMEEDLKRARSIMGMIALPDRTQRILAKRRIDDEDD